MLQSIGINVSFVINVKNSPKTIDKKTLMKCFRLEFPKLIYMFYIGLRAILIVIFLKCHVDVLCTVKCGLLNCYGVVHTLYNA